MAETPPQAVDQSIVPASHVAGLEVAATPEADVEQRERQRVHDTAFKAAYTGSAAEYREAIQRGTPGPKEQAAKVAAERAVAAHDWNKAIATDDRVTLFARLDRVRPSEDAPKGDFKEFDALLGELTFEQRGEYLDSRYGLWADRKAAITAAQDKDAEPTQTEREAARAQEMREAAARAAARLRGQTEAPSAAFRGNAPEGWDAERWQARVDYLDTLTARANHGEPYAMQVLGSELEQLHRTDSVAYAVYCAQSDPNRFAALAHEQAVGYPWEHHRGASLNDAIAREAFRDHYQIRELDNRALDSFGQAMQRAIDAGRDPGKDPLVQEIWNQHPHLQDRFSQTATSILDEHGMAQPGPQQRPAGERLSAKDHEVLGEFERLFTLAIYERRQPVEDPTIRGLIQKYPHLGGEFRGRGEAIITHHLEAEASGGRTGDLENLQTLQDFEQAVISAIMGGGSITSDPEVLKLFHAHPRLQKRMTAVAQAVVDHFKAMQGQGTATTSPLTEEYTGPDQSEFDDKQGEGEGENLWETLSPEEHGELSHRFNRRVQQIRAERRGRNMLSRAARAFGRSVFTGLRTPEEIAEEEVYGQFFKGHERPITDEERMRILEADPNFWYERYGDFGSRALSDEEHRNRLWAESWRRGSGFDVDVQMSPYSRGYDVARVQHNLVTRIRNMPEVGQQLRARNPRQAGESTRNYNLRLTQLLAQSMSRVYESQLGARRPHTLRPGEAIRSWQRGRAAREAIVGSPPRRPARPGRPVHAREERRFETLASRPNMRPHRGETVDDYTARLMTEYDAQYGTRRDRRQARRQEKRRPRQGRRP